MAIELLAPAKVNLTLEILGRRNDGYHEILSIMQTIDLADHVRVSEASSLELVVTGEEQMGVPIEGPRNLAYKAAAMLQEESGNADLGARIELDKRIPAGLGLGGGSSDAAAVLRALDRLWNLNMDIEALCQVAARVGSDVGFFLHGGTALALGRGEIVEPLPDHPEREFTLFLTEIVIADKTRRMYSVVVPADFTDGRRTRIAAETLRLGRPLVETDLVNCFDRRIGEVAPQLARAMETCRDAGVGVIAAGSGPGFLAWTPRRELPTLLLRELDRQGIEAIACRSLSRSEAIAMREV